MPNQGNTQRRSFTDSYQGQDPQVRNILTNLDNDVANKFQALDPVSQLEFLATLHTWSASVCLSMQQQIRQTMSGGAQTHGGGGSA